MEFRGVDVVVDRRLGVEEIRQGVAAVLSVELGRVSVIDDIAEYPERGDADVVCVITPMSGEFVAVISIQCEPVEVSFSNVLETVQQLSSSLRVTLLAPDSSPDPYSMWLVRPSFPPQRVSLDESALARERYEVRGAARG